MIKLSRVDINPDNVGSHKILVLEISYYLTEDEKRTEYQRRFWVGQRWFREDNYCYEIKEITTVMLKTGRNRTKFYMDLQKIDGPQTIRVELPTLLKFWSSETTEKENRFNNNNRFEIIE